MSNWTNFISKDEQRKQPWSRLGVSSVVGWVNYNYRIIEPDRNYPPWNLYSTWKIVVGRLFSFWVSAYIQGRTVGFRKGIRSIPKKTPPFWATWAMSNFELKRGETWFIYTPNGQNINQEEKTVVKHQQNILEIMIYQCSFCRNDANKSSFSTSFIFNFRVSGQMEQYFTNLDFPEIAGDFPVRSYVSFPVFCFRSECQILSVQGL